VSVAVCAVRRADRLQRAIAINSVIAWRIMVMTLLGRQVPGCDAGLLFTEDERSYLTDYARDYGIKRPVGLGEVVRLVAHLGGYRGRRHDPDPGHQVMWYGLDFLSKAAQGYRTRAKYHPSSNETAD